MIMIVILDIQQPHFSSCSSLLSSPFCSYLCSGARPLCQCHSYTAIVDHLHLLFGYCFVFRFVFALPPPLSCFESLGFFLFSRLFSFLYICYCFISVSFIQSRLYFRALWDVVGSLGCISVSVFLVLFSIACYGALVSGSF
jgi:hypothetical protein